ncbi:quinoprotein dehydrogenase-associated probable ABC transporter substrate-binding protein [Amaricoccus macauensis]|uniref:Quinoprotein dehydrogenase-associated probable ABC transporter substrate-binding protein n=1 Tax=Amaricoccus macauensis TaxID=57001 RepID=A0A840SNM6_9RHOB|nr:substrate-binding domain-containing protein [Amaricoccus macauensis]MBB5222360.1 quinoprotein dehydrogenase-associated probable ABC transporter substrate-binding protein [Amaricoccus macauensis]
MPAWVDLSGRTIFAAALIAAAIPASGRAQVADLVSPTAFRVCADPANKPLSDKAGEGFENKIAELMAEHLGRELQYTWFPMAQGFVRRTLTAVECDVIMGYAQGDELVLNTNAYYTSAYVIVTRADSDLHDVTTIEDPRLKGRKIGYIANTPPGTHLARLGMIPDAVSYSLMVDTRLYHPNEDLLADLADGKVDAALMWGPIAGPLAKNYDDKLVVTPLIHETEAPRLFYRITMGVRPGEDRWKRTLNSEIRKVQPEIDQILTDFGVPLLNDSGTELKELPTP